MVVYPSGSSLLRPISSPVANLGLGFSGAENVGRWRAESDLVTLFTKHTLNS